jgi:hypothetical protein
LSRASLAIGILAQIAFFHKERSGTSVWGFGIVIGALVGHFMTFVTGGRELRALFAAVWACALGFAAREIRARQLGDTTAGHALVLSLH